MEPRVAPSEVTRPSGDDPHQRHASATHDDPLDWHAIDGRHFANVEPMADPPLAQIMSADRMQWRGGHQHGKHKVCGCVRLS